MFNGVQDQVTRKLKSSLGDCSGRVEITFEIYIYIHVRIIYPFELYIYVHCVKSLGVWSYSGPHFPAFGFNTDLNNSEYEHVLPNGIYMYVYVYI